MREVDPQSDSQLRKALRRLASASPQSLPAEAGAELLGKFRRHHARRRWIHRGGTIALVGAVVLTSLLLWWRGPSPRHSGQNDLAKTVTRHEEKPPAPPAPVVVAAPKPAQTTPMSPRPARQATIAANRAFLALPAYDP